MPGPHHGVGPGPVQQHQRRRVGRVAGDHESVALPGRDGALLGGHRPVLQHLPVGGFDGVQAARTLADTSPSRIPEAVATLRGLAETANPLHRCAVLLALGPLDPATALPRLRAMAQDHTLPPVARLRCATALASLRRDERDTAAAVARDLLHDGRVPHHVRRHAARSLARWSPLCRQEARNVLRRSGVPQEDPT
jgi:cellulose synthase operon protein C